MPISVIIPVYNGERFLERALISIERQTLKLPLEILVIDDGSTDKTAHIASTHRGIRLISQQNEGPAAARNKGILEAKGDLLAFLDADDLWPEDKLANQYSYLDENPLIDIALGHLQYLQTDRRDDPLSPGPLLCASFGAALIRKAAFEKVGLLNSDLRFGEDTDWFLRARELGCKIGVLQDIVLFYRLHQANATYRKNCREMGILSVLRNSLVRRESPLQPLEWKPQ